MKRNTIIAAIVTALITAATMAHAQDTTLAVTADGKVGIGTTSRWKNFMSKAAYTSTQQWAILTSGIPDWAMDGKLELLEGAKI